ncbi:sulfide/dihydroorotate dehydrogenase-like FAD/NAD-binding protein [Clostridium felsineum]|uniref:sulfide/dihydroorotate dehydrogenase-like FAD/NAD-binding protein n=1 Tax=Clostridium felsineum TaxID=36839 RepID=UPI00098BEBC7|nr:sulfide/dihydroorotate dehydrogenase-like FAD/NAD-binding protein [Clostridium felsineum]MCR3761250.1 sulfide/dihydroorotate dehydrogenase-like FAD/NAD-binding protein [Clostridium felsineum]URZ00658.1 Dihydroorotate dehydrogenase B (NAD(+)), electron transfer subunit [Clostridium felsineum]
MNYEIIDCIDSGTEYCPCHLAESGNCILCSQLKGKDFCDCTNWKGVCIYQEYTWNGNKAKIGRSEYVCKVLKKELLDANLVSFTILTKKKLTEELLYPGSYVFLRSPKSSRYYSSPISIMEASSDENVIKVVIEVRGTKTKNITDLNENDNIVLRGPYWNGILGLKNVYSAKEGISLVIARGIGEAPIVPVIKKLYSNGNKVVVISDKGKFENSFINKYLEAFSSETYNFNTLNNNGELNYDFKDFLLNFLKFNKVNLIHTSGPNILTSNILEIISEDVKISCSNNAKMCCGEGICGACTNVYNDDKIKRMCKVQIDPRYLFKGLRSI